MKIEKATATLIASVSGVLIGGTAVGVLLLTSNGGTSKPPAPVETIQPAANQIVTSPAPTSIPASTPPPAARSVAVAPKKEAQVTANDPTVTPADSPSDAPAQTPPAATQPAATTTQPGPPGYHASTHYGPTDGLTPPPSGS